MLELDIPGERSKVSIVVAYLPVDGFDHILVGDLNLSFSDGCRSLTGHN